ncbi:SRPBCC family protein [Microbacterium halophytorum]|uniref:SRPBCC family protein n=1 Tax=Microbacterium halophytorum TaxID=2067568 RepID=UPI000CFBF7BD|nr:SRPBCC family protein [Microbacterium halophytorum]
MPVTNVEKDLDALTMTIVADFAVPVERLWNAYADPRQIEKFWGPPEYPATFTRHDVAVGGESHYVMTGPDGDVSAGYWHFLAVDEGRSFTVRDGFSTEDGEPNADMPSMEMTFTFESTPNGSRLTGVTTFPSLEELEQLIAMGMEEGTRAAMGQIDDVLADLASFAAGRGTETQILSDTQVRVSRIIRGSVEEVWRAHHDADLIRRWMLGPDGWVMPVVEPTAAVGESYRFEWERSGGGDRFGFTGEVLASNPPHYEAATEQMIGVEGSTRNELTLTAVPEGTLISTVITYPSAEVRDTVLETGMADGMESSYARLEAEVLA